MHVEDVLVEALNLLEGTLPENIALQAGLESHRAGVIGDPTQVHQVVMNLLSNAVQAMPGGGTIEVAAAVRQLPDSRVVTTGRIGPGDFVVVSVTDSGAGIAPEIRERIFDPFFTTKKAGEGSGLGLSLVHGIVLEMGGAIDVGSVVGRSSRFDVYLPKAADVVEAGALQDTKPRRGRHEHVLVVDDEDMLLRLVTTSLGGRGYVCVGFTSAVQALAAFRAHPDRYDAVVTDERMPEMSGMALIGELRTLRPSLPVVLLSGFIGSELRARGAAAGVNALLGKPVAANQLASVLGDLLQPAAADNAGQRFGRGGG